ncbi:MAG: hypothetical protein IKF90_06380 [Parasporobacterium sp.]|nr:hypothetical protein [Parasporobacterium sp.]
MCIKKKLLSVVLTVLMILSMGLSVFATVERSPGKIPDNKPKNPGWVRSSSFDVNHQDHIHNIVKTKIGQKTVVVRSITALKGDAKSEIHLRFARDKDNNRVPITHIGNGETGLFDSKTGSYLKDVVLKSKKRITVRANAFRNSYVKRLYLSSSFFTLKSGCFTGTNCRSLIITLDDEIKYSGRVTFEDGCFDGLSSSAKVIVQKNCAAQVTFNRIKKKLRAAGFPGQIIYK